jgi:hypothetical protein
MKIKLSGVRLSFPGLWKAEPFKPGDDPKFKATFLVEKDSALDKAVNEAIIETAKAKWGAKATSVLKGMTNNPNKYCYQDGDTKSYDGYEGMMALSAKNGKRPLVIDRDRTTLTEADGKPYAGCYVNASVEFFAYENSGNGISASLLGVQFLKDGDAFGGGSIATEDDFDELEEGADADDVI